VGGEANRIDLGVARGQPHHPCRDWLKRWLQKERRRRAAKDSDNPAVFTNCDAGEVLWPRSFNTGLAGRWPTKWPTSKPLLTIWGLDLVFSCWLLVGQRFLVGMGSGRKRLNILGAYCPDDHEYLVGHLLCPWP